MKKLNLRSKPRWMHELLGIIALLAAYGVVSRALDTGSWWQYFAGFVLIVTGIKWCIWAIKGNDHNKDKATEA